MGESSLCKRRKTRELVRRGKSVNRIELCPTGAVAVVSSKKWDLLDPVISLYLFAKGYLVQLFYLQLIIYYTW